MLDDYKAAKKLGDDAAKKAVAEGKSPYLPVLDQYLEGKRTAGETRLGLMELPLELIAGNKTISRNNAFANNFMPIFEIGTEFAVKWSDLYDSCKVEGVRDAIKAYEYMNHYYIMEGNKRVSVSKYLKSEYILADVTRIKPALTDEKEVKVYYEYLEFYRCTGIFTIIFSEPGEYAKLAELLGQDLENEWDEDLCKDLKSAYLRFCKAYRFVFKKAEIFTLGDTFLMYISIFPFKTIEDSSNDQIISNIRLAAEELSSDNDIENIAFVSEAPISKKKTATQNLKNIFTKDLFANEKKYTTYSPLKIGFIYDTGVEASRWTNSHEAGRLYVEEMESGVVKTNCYFTEESGGDISEALKNAISDKNEVIFTISPYMMDPTMNSALKNSNIKFLNCSIGKTQNSVRAYHGKLYEATFLMGILAACCLEGSDNHTIGYLADFPAPGNTACINAFALGASLIVPDCKIDLKWASLVSDRDYLEKWNEQGINVYSDVNFYNSTGIASRSGVYKLMDGQKQYMGTPYYNWGRYYDQIVRSILSGMWDAKAIIGAHSTMNYWFGLNTGVVDIRLGKNVPYQTKKLLELFKSGIISGGITPFSGEIHSANGIIQSSVSEKASAVSSSVASLTPENIIMMDWLCDNINGTIPVKTDLTPHAQRLMTS